MHRQYLDEYELWCNSFAGPFRAATGLFPLATCVCICLQVRYVIALLRDLLVALDVAQRVLGFAHYDLK